MYYLTTVKSLEEAVAFILIQQDIQSEPQAFETLGSFYLLCRVTFKTLRMGIKVLCSCFTPDTRARVSLRHVFLLDLVEQSPFDWAEPLSVILFKLGGGI